MAHSDIHIPELEYASTPSNHRALPTTAILALCGDQISRWEAVAAAIRKMDDDEYPIVQLSWKDVNTCFDDDESFNFIGAGTSGFALFEMMPGWNFENPDGSEEDVRLWQK
jgi:hypothetical protein